MITFIRNKERIHGQNDGWRQRHDVRDVRVAGAVRDKFEVDKVKADKGKENCVVIAARAIPETELRAAIDATGYETTSYQSEPYEKKGFFSKLFG